MLINPKTMVHDDHHHHHHHHHHHRPNRIALPSRIPISTIITHPPSTPTPTPSKHRLSTFTSATKRSTTSLSFFLLLFSLRSLYPLLPFLRSSPSSFSIFPFSFLVSLLSFLLTFSFTFFTSLSSSSSSKDPFFQKQPKPIFSITSLTLSQLKLLLSKSLLLSLVFLLRFQALRYCGTSSMILAELSGNVAAKNFSGFRKIGSFKIRGVVALVLGLFMLSVSWDRVECFPFNVGKFGDCVRVRVMLLPFMAGFCGSYERGVMNVGSVRELGGKRVRLITLFFTTVVLFIPAVVSMFVFEVEGESVDIVNLGWLLVNTVVFGVLLSEGFGDENMDDSKDFQREYGVTFLCILVLELFYFPELSLWGLLIAGLLLWVAVRDLDPLYSDYAKLGLESSELLIMKPLRHILSERKSRKIALFLLINTAYMVVEFVAGFMSNSLGLISDACHMLFDCAALAIGLYASYISRLPSNGQFNYGRGRFEVLSGYVNAVFLVLVGALIVLESMERILDPQEISTNSLLSVSIGGFLVNVVGLIFFHEEHHQAHGGSGSCSHSHSHHADENKENESVTCEHVNGHQHGHHNHHDDHREQVSERKEPLKKGHNHHHMDHNMEGIFLHVLADTLGSVGVVISTLLIKYKGWLVADPACSIFISILIVSSVIPLLRNSAEILLQRVPRAHEQDLKDALKKIMKLKGVCGIRNFHVWNLTNSDVVGTLHLHLSAGTDEGFVKTQVSHLLTDAGIKDLTIHVEHVGNS